MKSYKIPEGNTIEAKIVAMMQRIWQSIAFDVLGEEGNCIARDEVIDCVADFVDRDTDREAYEAFRDLSFEEQERVGVTAFPDPEYGW